MTSRPHKLQVDNIHKRFGANEVLKGVSLVAHAGDVISIIGSSGSGKSTFLRCINLLEKPHEGRVSESVAHAGNYTTGTRTSRDTLDARARRFHSSGSRAGSKGPS